MASTADLEAEILAELEEDPDAYVTPVNDVITIDPETRTIRLPASEMLFGVEEEKDVERKFFKCPRIVGDNIDLAAHQIYISYMAVKDKNATLIPELLPETYWCEDVNVDDTGNYITFSWLLSGNVLRNRGFVGFAVIAKSLEGEMLKTRWKTAPAVGTVLMTIPDGGEAVAEMYPDIISQLLNRMDEVEAIATPEAIQNHVEAYLAENPPSGMTDEEREQLQKNTEDISSLSEEIANKTGTGLSTEAIDKLEEVGNYLVYTTADGGSKWTELIAILRNGSSGGGSGEIVPATGISLDKITLSFTTATTQTLTATVEPSNSTDKVTWESSNTGIATVSGGVVTPVSNGSCTITAKAGSYYATCEVTVAVEFEIVTYTITNNLTNVSTDNPVTTVNENSGYTANLTADTDYTIDSVTVTMGGVDITSTAYANGVVTISSVTGNVVITAIASEPQSEEVVLLKSITGDGASYIDTEVTPQQLGLDQLFEFSMKIDGWTTSNQTNSKIFGCNKFSIGGAYGRTTINIQGQIFAAIIGKYNGHEEARDSDGIWNYGATPNLRIERQWYKCAFTSQGALSATYLDEEMTQIPSSGNASFTAFSNLDEAILLEELPIEPNYLFAFNETTITPSTITLYEFKIKKYSTGELLHEFLPAKQGAKVGMYDTVTQKFHENKGSGTFSYEEVEA